MYLSLQCAEEDDAERPLPHLALLCQFAGPQKAFRARDSGGDADPLSASEGAAVRDVGLDEVFDGAVGLRAIGGEAVLGILDDVDDDVVDLAPVLDADDVGDLDVLVLLVRHPGQGEADGEVPALLQEGLHVLARHRAQEPGNGNSREPGNSRALAL